MVSFYKKVLFYTACRTKCSEANIVFVFDKEIFKVRPNANLIINYTLKLIFITFLIVLNDIISYR